MTDPASNAQSIRVRFNAPNPNQPARPKRATGEFRPPGGRPNMAMDTDYLVVGAGASGLAFADTLLAEAAVAVTLVDRREAPGGHWRQAYPFVRLHTPSAFYGVNSLALGQDRIDQTGENAGFYERATGQDVREYFATVAERLTRTGRFHLHLR